MNLEEVYKLWDRFENSNLSEFEIDSEGTHLSLKKSVMVNSEVVASSTPKTMVETKEVKAPSSKAIKAPLVGTFYVAASPDMPPFVSKGKEVKRGDVIGIIEAMKLMNEVIATEDGIVDEILVEDGSFVEFDQELVTLL